MPPRAGRTRKRREAPDYRSTDCAASNENRRSASATKVASKLLVPTSSGAVRSLTARTNLTFRRLWCVDDVNFALAVSAAHHAPRREEPLVSLLHPGAPAPWRPVRRRKTAC